MLISLKGVKLHHQRSNKPRIYYAQQSWSNIGFEEGKSTPTYSTTLMSTKEKDRYRER